MTLDQQTLLMMHAKPQMPKRPVPRDKNNKTEQIDDNQQMLVRSCTGAASRINNSETPAAATG